MEESTKDKTRGGFDEAKGKIKEEVGKLTGNKDLQARGTAEKVGGKVEKKVGDVERVLED